MTDLWWTAYIVLLPVLTGLTFLFLLHHLLAFWRVERKSSIIALALVYLSQFVLFLLYSLYAKLSPLVRAGDFISHTVILVYLFLTVSLAISNFLEWRTLFMQLWRKDNKKALESAEAVVKLVDVADADAVLEAIDVAKE